MEAKKQLRKPEDWPSFENLCKKLWGEIWECPEITKNGRSGQQQDGVDISGIPKGKDAYYGVQCKGKDEYTHKKLTQKEIDAEIRLAKAFKPALKKFYIATTANKDAKIEQYVRERNIENRQAGLFDVALFSWEDIVDLIDENRETHDWYLGLNKYKVRSNVKVTFENDISELQETVPFCKEHVRFVHKATPKPGWHAMASLTNVMQIGNGLRRKKNLSYSRARLKISNTGNYSIENFKLLVKVNGNLMDMENGDLDTYLIPHYSNTDIKIKEGVFEFTVAPKQNVLVPGDTYVTGEICIKPEIEGSELNLKWTFLSSSLKKDGELQWRIGTKFIQRFKEELIGLEDEERGEVNILDFIKEDGQ